MQSDDKEYHIREYTMVEELMLKEFAGTPLGKEEKLVLKMARKLAKKEK